MAVPKQYLEIIERVETLAGELGIPDPLSYHMVRASGRDPRPMDSPLLALVRDIAYRAFEDDGDPLPTEGEWQEIVNEVLGSALYKQARVSSKESAESMNKVFDIIYARKMDGARAAAEAEKTTDPLQEPSEETILKVRKIFEYVY